MLHPMGIPGFWKSPLVPFGKWAFVPAAATVGQPITCSSDIASPSGSVQANQAWERG